MRRFVLLICILFSLFLSSCGKVKDFVEYKQEETQRLTEMSPVSFEEIGIVKGGLIMRCEQNGVLYIMSTGSYNYGNYTLLINPDGSPMVWEDK